MEGEQDLAVFARSPEMVRKNYSAISVRNTDWPPTRVVQTIEGEGIFSSKRREIQPRIGASLP
jgi:hypothetical protein